MSKQKSSRLRATPFEDMMLQRALATYKKGYKAIVLFMQRNAEVMGEELEKFYTEAGVLGSAAFKKATQRVRKRTTKLLQKRNGAETVTSVEDEYISSGSEAVEENSDDIGTATRKIEKHDKRFCVETSQEALDNGKDNQEAILRQINANASPRADAELPSTSTPNKRKRSRKSKSKAMNDVMESLPGLIHERHTAAREHTKALKMWSKSMSRSWLVSSSSEADEN